MTNKSKKELKRIAVTALKAEYGFAPKTSEITLYESSDDGTYILFAVNGQKYTFDSYISHVGDFESLWCGKGSISQGFNTAMPDHDIIL